MRTLAIVLLLVGCGDTGEPEPLAGSRSEAEAVAVNSFSIADATVRDGTYASFPQGNLQTLEVKTQEVGWTRFSYLRFDITGMPESGGTAILYMYGTFVGSGPPVRARVCAVGDSTWNEQTLTWNNAPAIDRVPLATALVSGEPNWYTWNLTTYVRAEKAAGATEVNLALQNDEYNSALARFNSRENPFNQPDLFLSPANGNTAPTVAAPASADPAVVFRDTTTLRALGTDDSSEINLTYTWETLGTPPGPVQYTNGNGTNLSQNTYAHFSAAGTYDFRVTITDTEGLSVTSDVTVTVAQTLRSVVVSPQTAALHSGETLQLAATARDQFQNPLAPQPAIDWAADYNGSVTPSGLYTAGPELGGPFYVYARTGHYADRAQITIVP